MALPVPESAAGPREDIIRLLGQTPEGLSDGELAAVLAERWPGLNAKAANHQCRRLVATGMVERVGTRPIRTRLVAGMQSEAPSPDAEVTPSEGHTTQVDQPSEMREVPLDEAGPQSGAAPAPDAVVTPSEGHTTEIEQPSEVREVPLDEAGAGPARLSPVQADIIAALADAPTGLTDNELAAALAAQHPHVDPKAFNYQCRKLAKAGLVERTARSKDAPIRSRLTPAAVEGYTTHPEQAEDLPDVPLAEVGGEGGNEGGGDDADAPPPTAPTLIQPQSRRPRPRAKTPSDDVARIRRSERDGDDPDEPLLRFLPFASPASARTALRERMAERAALRRVPEPSNEVVLPTRDVLQGWSRTQNVAAAVAGWLTRRGGTIRAAHAVGPAHDLVATLDGDDVHVEVTGWPPDGARSHPSTLAGDWFRAAARAATQRRRAHPRSRVVIALPDTRRYRTLAEDHAEGLRQARAEVWFVDASGAVQVS
jgi:DNA-binding MarR family transcriptional regulator